MYPSPRQHNLARSAFSLIELTVTLLLVGIVAAAAGLRFAPALHRHRVDTAARRIVQDLIFARHAARSSNRSVTVTFDVAGSRYTMSPLLSSSGAATTETVRLAEGSASANLQSASLGGDAVLVFNGFGVPDSGGTLVLRSGGMSKTVTVAATGAASTP